MGLCILAASENVNEVRLTARTVLPDLSSILDVPVSPTGAMPPTHWFCCFKVSPEMCDTLLGLENLSEMQVTNSPKDFLGERGLKPIVRLS